MEYIHKLPFIIGAFAAVVVGIVNYRLGADQQQVYTRIAISLVLFFAIGLVIRNQLSSILEELEKRRKEQEEIEEQKRLENLSNHSEENMNVEDFVNGSQQGIDYRVDDGEEFTPLKVSEFLSSTGDK